MSVLRTIVMELALFWALTTLATWAGTRLLLAGATRMRLPAEHWTAELARRAGMGPVAYYSKAIDRTTKVAAFATWTPGEQAVVLSLRHLLWCSTEELHFITAHELGHLALGHARHGFIRNALGYGMAVPISAAERQRREDEADTFAWHLTGIEPARIRAKLSPP